MKIVLKDNNAQNIKRARHIFRCYTHRMSLTIRHGRIYTMRYNPGTQPRTESQERSWSVFKEANRLTTADFHKPQRRAYWQQRLKSQSRYKTARGLARAYYIALLKRHIASATQDIKSSTVSAVACLRPVFLPSDHPSNSAIRRPTVLWSHYRNIHWFRTTIAQCITP